MFENRGPNEVLWTSSCNHLAYSAVHCVRAIVVTINYQTTFDTRLEGLVKFAEELYKETMGSQKMYDSMVFLVTHIGLGRDGNLTLDMLHGELSRHLSDLRAQERACLRALARKYPYRTPPGASPRFNLSAATEAKDPDLLKLTSLEKQVQLLKSMNTKFDGGDSKIVLSDPHGAVACAAIKEDLRVTIDRTPALKDEDLRVLSQQTLPDHSFTLQSVTSLLAGKHLNDLCQLSTLLVDLQQRYDEPTTRDLMTSIDNSWGTVRDQLVQRMEREIHVLEQAVASREREIKDLTESVREMDVDSKQLKKPVSTAFIYVEWLVGKLTATADYQYNGQPIVNVVYDTNNEVLFEIVETERDDTNGTLQVQLTSANDIKGLDVTVHVRVYEKDHPSTIQRVQLLRQQVATKTQNMEHLRATVIAYEATTSSETFKDAVDKEVRESKEQIMSIEQRLQREVTPPAPHNMSPAYTAWQSIRGLAEYFKLVDNLHKWHPQLRDTTTMDTIQQFRSCLQSIDEAHSHSRVKDMLRRPPPAPPVPEPVIPPVRTSAMEMWMQCLHYSTQGINKVASSPQRWHSLELGGACLVLGWLLWLQMLLHLSTGPSSMNTVVIATALIVYGSYSLLAWVRATTVDMTAAVKEAVKREKKDLHKLARALVADVQGELNLTRERVEAIADIFAARMSVDVDLRVNAREVMFAMFGGGVRGVVRNLFGI